MTHTSARRPTRGAKHGVQLEPIHDSSNVAATSHDPITNSMQVKFRNGFIYQYDGVPAGEHDALRAAPSVGGHFHQHVKSKYAGVRIG